jgi:hypothetical protein
LDSHRLPGSCALSIGLEHFKIMLLTYFMSILICFTDISSQFLGPFDWTHIVSQAAVYTHWFLFPRLVDAINDKQQHFYTKQGISRETPILPIHNFNCLLADKTKDDCSGKGLRIWLENLRILNFATHIL